MNRLILIIYATFCLSMLNGQNRAVDRVILHSKESHEGIVIEQKPGDYIRLWRIPQNDTMKFDLEEIDKLVKIVELDNNQEMVKDQSSKFNVNPIYIMIHGVTGGGDYSFQGFGLSAGRNFKSGIQVGIGIHYLGEISDNVPQRQTFPLSLDLRQPLTKSRSGRFSSLAILSTGYNFTINGSYYDESRQQNITNGNGFFLNPALGFRVNVTSKMGLLLDIGYQLNTSTLTRPDANESLGHKSWNTLLVRGSIYF